MNKFRQYIAQTYHIVPQYFKKKVKWSFALTLFNGLLDIISLAAIIPIALIFLNPTQIKENPNIFKVYQQLNFSSELTFQIVILATLIALFIVKNLVSVWVNFYISKMAFDISTALSKQSLQRFFKQNYLEFIQCNSAIISRNIKTIPHDFASYILIPQLNLVTESIVAGVIIIAISLYHPVICLLLISVMLPVMLTWKWFKKQHLNRVEDDFKNTYPISLKYLLQGVDSYIDVKLYQKEDFFIEKFIGLKRQMNRNYAYLKTASFLPPKILEVILVVSIALIFGYSSLFDQSSTLIPLLSLFIAGFYRLYPSVTRIINATTTLNAYSYVLHELKPSTNEDSNGSNEKIFFNQQILIKQVNFSYPGKDLLFKDLNLKILRGQCIGITGASGSGKTTLVKLLTGLITPDQGQLLIDHTVLTQKNMAGWLSYIGYLQQQPVIIDATLEENIAFGEHSIDIEKLQKVVQQTNLESFVDSLPKKLLTQLGENGLQVSGGQRQRIALARALYRNSELFIFDEISNNLDKANLLEIRSSVTNLLASGKTVILIDHDFTLLEVADKVWEVSHGRVYEKAPDVEAL